MTTQAKYPTKILLCAILSTSLTSWARTDGQHEVTLTGKSLSIDDALFSGCYHNAFEGLPVKQDNGTYKSGAQTISRTKGVLTGAGSSHSKMTLNFVLDREPTGSVKLILNGIDDRFETYNDLTVSLNDQLVGETIRFENNRNIQEGLNQRYFLGWKDISLTLPAKALKKGANTLDIANQTSVFDQERWTYAIIDTVGFEFNEEITMSISAPPTPMYYYGLTEGVETHLWPAVNIGDRICLVKDGAIQMNFFATLPKNKPLGTLGSLAEEPTRPKREILLHLQTDADVSVLDIDGLPIQGTASKEGRTYIQPIARLIKYETPHPAQGVGVFIQGNQVFENKTLTAWYSVDGVPYRKKVYPLRCVSLDPIPGRDQLDFSMGIWGGEVPKETESREAYINLITNAGFNRIFTGNDPELNHTLKTHGFEVFPRYGWFGHQFTVTKETEAWAAVDAKGKPMDKDFCPLAILENDGHPELGRYFAIAREMAAQKDIDGICVDYETAPVWCWCDRCLAKFQEETGHQTSDRSLLSGNGALSSAYKDFGRRRNRDLLARVKEIMLQVNPDLEYHALASASDIPSYWYDGRNTGRHAVKELVTFADEIYASLYCYELPGGVKSAIPIVETVSRYALAANRAVASSLIAPIATTISEVPRYRAARMRPDLTRLLALSTALGGGKGLLLFRGDSFDGEYYLACRQATEELLKLKPYLDAGIPRSFEIEFNAQTEGERVIEIEMAQNLLSRLVWRPDLSYQYDSVQLLKDPTGNDRVVVLLNYSHQPLNGTVKVRGLYDPSYEIRDLITGKLIDEVTRLDIESGKVEVRIPARDALFLQIRSGGM